MRKAIFWCLIYFTAQGLAAASGKYQPLNIKTGLWETTTITKISGRPPIPADMLAQMSPEQRARAEAAISQMASRTPKTRTEKNCVTQQDLERDPFNKDDKSCKETVVNSTGSKAEIHEVCTEDNVQFDVMVHIEAVTSEYVKGTVQSNASGNGNTVSVNGNFTSKYLGPLCKDRN